jgi:hypothetical protein
MTSQTTIKTLFLSLVISFASSSAIAQQPVRPVDQPRSVTLSLNEYNRLLDLSARAPVPAGVAPTAAVLASADLTITVDRDTARGTFNLTGQVLHSGVTRVPLVHSTTLVDATSGGRPVPLVTDGNTLQALINGPGAFAISAEWGGPLTYRPGRASFVISVPQAGAARATIDLPGEQADVRLAPGVITRRAVANGRTTVEATLDPGSATEVWWTMRDTAPVAAAKEVRALAEIMTLITLDDSDVRMAALIDVTVTQGELRTLSVYLPAGYEFQSVTGSTLEDSAEAGSDLILTVGNPAARRHQFLVTLERPHAGGSFALATGVVSLKDIQRERGEIAIEGIGTMDLVAADEPGLHRIDVRELNASLQSLARLPVLSAFRYQRPSGAVAPRLALDIKRFADAGVLAAAADRATATTMITSEGRALTEVVLEMRNRSQPFLKVELPPGATIVSVDLAGHSAKPASGPDGTRIPLMRAGLPASGRYAVSFVYMHAGTPFQKRGEIDLSLPKLDVPVAVVAWEVFVPEQYSARAIDGNMIDARRFRAVSSGGGYRPASYDAPVVRSARVAPGYGGLPGQIRGEVRDSSGGTLPGVTVRLAVGRYQTLEISDASGMVAFSNVPHGDVILTSELAGFSTSSVGFRFDGTPKRVQIEMGIGTPSESVTVTGDSLMTDIQPEPKALPPSQNVVNLQARAAGVLPIRVDVPRAGTSHEFIKPLVVGTEATVKLRYKRN